MILDSDLIDCAAIIHIRQVISFFGAKSAGTTHVLKLSLCQVILLPAVVTMRAQQGSSCNGASLTKLLLGLSQWHVECLAWGNSPSRSFGRTSEYSFIIGLMCPGIFLSHKCIASRTLIQTLFNLIVTNQVHYHLSFAIITLFQELVHLLFLCLYQPSFLGLVV